MNAWRGWVAVATATVGLVAPASASADPYVALGDSYTAGAHTYATSLYSTYQSSLGANEFTNLGSGGATSVSILSSQVPTALTQINDTDDTKAVTVLAGGNDVLQGGPCSTPDGGSCSLRSNLDSIFNQLSTALAGDPGTEVFIGGLYPNPNSGTGSALEATRDTQLLGQDLALDAADTDNDAGLNDIILKEATEAGASTANPYPAFKACGQAFISIDGLHPNSAGHAALAQVFRGENVTCPSTPGTDPTPGTGDTTAPATTITGKPTAKTAKKKATFEFSSSEAGSTFECSLNGAPFTACTTPLTVKGKKGKNSFAVRAKDAAGNVDGSPATFDWKVKKKKGKKKR